MSPFGQFLGLLDGLLSRNHRLSTLDPSIRARFHVCVDFIVQFFGFVRPADVNLSEMYLLPHQHVAALPLQLQHEVPSLGSSRAALHLDSSRPMRMPPITKQSGGASRPAHQGCPLLHRDNVNGFAYIHISAPPIDRASG